MGTEPCELQPVFTVGWVLSPVSCSRFFLVDGFEPSELQRLVPGGWGQSCAICGRILRKVRATVTIARSFNHNHGADSPLAFMIKTAVSARMVDHTVVAQIHGTRSATVQVHRVQAPHGKHDFGELPKT